EFFDLLVPNQLFYQPIALVLESAGQTAFAPDQVITVYDNVHFAAFRPRIFSMRFSPPIVKNQKNRYNRCDFVMEVLPSCPSALKKQNESMSCRPTCSPK